MVNSVCKNRLPVLFVIVRVRVFVIRCIDYGRVQFCVCVGERRGGKKVQTDCNLVSDKVR